MRDEIVRPLKKHESGTETHFLVHFSAPDNDRVRSLRARGKKLQRVYNYERDNAAPYWTALVYANADRNMTPLAQYDNLTGVMKINSCHHQVLIKTLTSVMAFHWPKVCVEPTDMLSSVRYAWGDAPEPRHPFLILDEYGRSYS